MRRSPRKTGKSALGVNGCWRRAGSAFLACGLALACTRSVNAPVSTAVPVPEPAFEEWVVPHGALWEGAVYDRFVIRFVGNLRVPARALATTLRATQGVLDDDVLQYDEWCVLGWYFDHGYVQARVDHPFVDTTSGIVRLTIGVHEGLPFTISSIDVFEDRGSTIGLALGWHGQVRSDVTFDRRRLVDALQSVKRAYQDLGFAFVTANPITKLDEAHHRIAITVPVVPGMLYRFGRIELVGAKTVSEKLLLERLSVKAGDLYSETELVRSKQRLIDTGWFERVDLAVKVGVLPDLLDLSVEVDEAHVPIMSAMN